MRKVLQLELSGIGGIESFLYNVYSHMDREQYHFDFVTAVDTPGYGEELKNLGARIFRISSLSEPVRYKADLKKIMSYNYDVIHINKNSAANILPFIAARKHSEACVIAHSHNTRPSTGNGLAGFMHRCNQKKLYALSDVHLACSTEAGKWLYGNHDFVLIPNGIDVQKFRFDENVRAEYRKKLMLGDAFTLIAVGRFSEQKNYERLIDIFSEIVKRKDDSVLLLVGDGELNEQIQEKVKELSLNDKVKFLGIREDVNKLLMASDCFVMPSLYEGLPVSVIEAQASGLPVFVSHAVSNEAKVIPDFHHFSLEDSNGRISDKILECKRKTSDERLIDNDMIKSSGFNIKNTVRKLTEIYDNCYLYKNSKEQ